MSAKIKRFLKYLTYRLGESRVKCMTIMLCMLVAVLIVFAFSVNKVTVYDGATYQTIYSLKSNQSELLKLAVLQSPNYQVINFSEKGKKINISLAYTFPVYITVGDETKTIDFLAGGTVADAIFNAGIKLDEYDIVNISTETVLNDTTYIDIIDINYVTDSYTKKIPYTSKTVYSNKTTTKTITTPGEEGIIEVRTKTKIVNGVSESTEIIGETVLKEAVQQVVTVGTKKPTTSVTQSVSTSASVKTISTLIPASPIVLDSKGNPVNYKQHITVEATAYSAPGYKGASGMQLQSGCVAVNTSIFPYGTKFYIKSSDGKFIYGYAVAADTGTFIYSKPTNFDLYFATFDECCAFGRRNIEVWVLE